MDKIWIITTIRNINKEDGTFVDHKSRNVGWTIDLEDAIKTVEGNYGDIYEYGNYPYCVIEQSQIGLYGFTMKEVWFEWKNDGYKKIDKPKGEEGICGYW